jgi:hypothetical protein
MGPDTLIPIVVVPVIFFSVVAVFKILSDNSLRKAIVDKGLVDENVKYLFRKTDASSSLKWGIILIALGAAIFIAQSIDMSDESIFGMMFLFAGAGLILYYFMTAKKPENDQLNQ